jgi:hypothetical protein
MNLYVSRFIINLAIFSLILGAIAYVMTYFLPAAYFSPVLPFLFPFFYSATVVVYYFLIKSTEKKFSSFINRFMLATFLKLMTYMAVLLIYVFAHKEDAVCFILAFFILYIAYTVFEVVAMLKYSRLEKK